ncbi:MAG: class I SAM-dependent methyltransferase [Halobacteriales archaeon]
MSSTICGDTTERFRRGEYPTDPDPSPVLRDYIDEFSDGRALDIATGPGRNALFLAEQGYTVDAIDRSREGLRIAKRNATHRDVAVDWIQADATEFAYPSATYDVITIGFFRIVDRLPDIKAALRPDGYLFYQHHLRTTDPVTHGPSSDRYRFAANELLRACLDLTILHYEETTETFEGDPVPTVELTARNSTGSSQTYPRAPRAVE